MFGKRISNLLRKITIVVIICCFCIPAQAKYGGGTGVPNDPYLIYTAQQMNEIGMSGNWDDWDKCFKLMADIDLSAYTGTEFNLIGYYKNYDDKEPFTGVFDGNGHTISYFTYTSTGINYIGLFWYVDGTNVEIKNLGLINPNVDAGTGLYAGSLVGLLNSSNGTITNCYVQGGSVSGNGGVGGLLGYNFYGIISNSYFTGSVSSQGSVGGLVGSNIRGHVTFCYSTGSVTGDSTVGGLVGRNYYGSISNCYSTGDVSGEGHFVGGLVGRNSDYGSISNSCFTGSVSGDWGVGGLVGHNSYRISYCYANNSVTGVEKIGGLVGVNKDRITGCYSIGSVMGDSYVGGLVGINEDIITNCYSTSCVLGIDHVGGLVGRNGHYECNPIPPCSWFSGTVVNSYSSGSVSGEYDVGGLVGYSGGDGEGVVYSFWDIETSRQDTSDGGTSKTTDEMQTAHTFFAWACGYISVWTIDDGVDYPRLWWENKPGELITLPSDLYGGGSGKPDDPYLIYTAEQLNSIGLVPCYWDKHFKLMADIDLSGYTGTRLNIIGNNSTQFTGVFDGSDHTISNFTYNSTGTKYIGLFGYVRGEVRDLGLIDPNVNAGIGDNVGSLVGELRYGTITNCYIEGGSVSGDYTVGGLVGRNTRGTITNSYSTCSVSGVRYVGGLVGINYRSTINNCYSSGSVAGNGYVGGLVGRNWEGTITNCYSTAGVVGDGGGGLVGSSEGTVSASFWDIETSGQDSSAGGTGLTTAEMQMMSTFTDAGWDFVGETLNGIEDIWFIPQGDYPHLWWEGMEVPMKLTPVSLNCRSQGNWVKAHIILPQGLTVEDVNSEKPAVLHSFGIETAYMNVFINEDGLAEIEAAIDREDFCSLVNSWPESLNLYGFLSDGNIFLGTSTVKILPISLEEVAELASYWLQGDCVYNDWCDGIDMNRDSLVNLLDYALLMNTNVEFVSNE